MRKLATQNRAVSVGYSIIVPLIVGVISSYYDDIAAINPALFWLIVAPIVICGFGLAWISVESRLAIEVEVENERLGTSESIALENLQYLSFLQGISYSWAMIVRSCLLSKEVSVDILKETASEMLDLLAESVADIYPLRTRERWSLAVYFWHSVDGRVFPVSRQKSPHHPSIGLGRIWEPGRGHVGIAFAHREAKICSDASSDEVWALFNQSEDTKSYDRDTYKSFVSVPISASNRAMPFGVVVATSNVPGRFDRESALVVKHLAGHLGSLIELSFGQATVDACIELDHHQHVNKEPAERSS